MSDLLSQDEINALLSAYESVNTADSGQGSDKRRREVRLYDFSRPDRFSKDHLRAINSIYTNYASALATLLSGLYQSPTRVEMIGIDQITYREYRASIPSKTLLAEVSSGVANYDFLLEVNPIVAGVWIDCMCGANPDMPAEPSELTPIDLAVTGKILNLCIETYRDTWASLIDLKPAMRRVVNSENYEDMFLPTETVLVVSFEIHAGSAVGMLTMCIPAAVIEAVLPILTAARSGRIGRHQDSAMEGAIKQMLSPVSLPCKVMLGRTEISMSEAMGLEVGDVIKVSKRADADIELWIGKRHMFNCRPGTKSNHLAVLISETVTPLADVGLAELAATPIDELEAVEELVA